MLHKITKATKNRPCSCSKHKECTGCAKKGQRIRDLNPHVYVENTDHLPVPILITKPKHKGNHVHIAESIKNSFTAVRHKYFEPAKTQSTVTEWVKKKKALNTLNNERKKEKKRLQEWERWKKRERELVRKAEIDGANKEKKRRKNEIKENKKRQKIKDQEELERLRFEREQEFYEQLREQEKYKAELAKHTLKTRHLKSLKSYSTEPSTYRDSGEQYYSSVSSNGEDEPKSKKPKKDKSSKSAKVKTQKQPKPVKDKNKKPPKATKVKTIYPKDKSSIVKPYSASRSVHVKEKKQKEKLSKKFVNCFYKFCCEFYCWMTIILAVGMAIILLL